MPSVIHHVHVSPALHALTCAGRLVLHSFIAQVVLCDRSQNQEQLRHGDPSVLPFTAKAIPSHPVPPP